MSASNAAVRSSEISTNVRKLKPAATAGSAAIPLELYWARRFWRALSTVAPPVAARLAARLFRTPSRPPARPLPPIFESGHRFQLHAAGRDLAVWSWGDGPTVILQHGWGSRAEHLAAFVGPLLEAGFSVIAPDAPGHGRSQGRTSSIPEFAAALDAVGRRVGPIAGFIGHSGGAAAGALALHQGLPLGRMVFLAPAAGLSDFVGGFANHLHIPPWVAASMREQLERDLGLPLSELDVPRVAPRFEAPLLVLHDRDDREVPWKDGAAIAQAWPGARLVSLAGLGHRRILRDPEVVAGAVSFLRGSKSWQPPPFIR